MHCGIQYGTEPGFLTSEVTVCVRTRVLAIVACYYPPNRYVSDILDDLADGIAKLSNCGTPIVIAGDFNCMIDSGTRGHELSSACGCTTGARDEAPACECSV